MDRELLPRLCRAIACLPDARKIPLTYMPISALDAPIYISIHVLFLSPGGNGCAGCCRCHAYQDPLLPSIWRMDGWTDGRTGGWADGWMYGWLVGWMDGGRWLVGLWIMDGGRWLVGWIGDDSTINDGCKSTTPHLHPHRPSTPIHPSTPAPLPILTHPPSTPRIMRA